MIVKTLSREFVRHWKVFCLIMVAVLALVSGVYAFLRSDAQPSLMPPSTPYAVVVSPPLELRIELDKTEFRLGETVEIRLYLKNISNQTVTLHFPTKDGQLGFEVRDSGEKIIYVGNPGMLPAISKWVLEPGELRNELLEWPQLRGAPERRQPPFTERVTRGTYEVIGRTSKFGLESLDKAASSPPRMKTSPITITIVMREASMANGDIRIIIW